MALWPPCVSAVILFANIVPPQVASSPRELSAMVSIDVSLTSAVPESVAKTPFDPELEAVMSVPSMTVVESSPTVSDTELVPE